MISWLTVTAAGLHGRSIQMDSQFVEKATMFPFFDHNGMIEYVAIVDEESNQIRFGRVAELDIRIPLFGVISIEGSMERVWRSAPDQLMRLWHFDPWWMLRASRYRNLPAATELIETNCVDEFERKVQSMFFYRDFSRMIWMTIGDASNVSIRRFRAGMLSKRIPPTRTIVKEQRGWAVAPIW